eukprot:superscaffoldBa00001014_g8534
MGKRRFSGLEVTLMVMFTMMTVAAIALIVLFVTGEPGVIKDETTEVFVPQCPNIPLAERIDCFPDAGASKLKCEQRGCCWGPLDERNVPWCFFSTNHGYTVESVEEPDPYEVILQPAPAVTYRTIGGVLDFYILFGDTPEQVVQEFLELIGRPVIPPYWSLGFQLSRWDYGSLNEVKKTVERNRAVGLPYDIQYTDIDYMEDKKDFTYDKVKFSELPQFADYLHEKGQRYILILDPAVATSKRVGNAPYESYDRGTEKNAWVTESDGKTPLLGEDMNEVANFKKGSNKGCADNNLNYPPYTPKILDEVMYSKTLCMDAKQAWGNHYDVHSLYGYSMVLATEKALQRVFAGNRTLMLTRSSFPGVGKYSGHWLGDNAANWNDIKWAIPGMLEFGLFGIPYIGADICGFFDDSSEELCRRWMQVGAFYPFSRNHNAQGFKPQDPAVFGAGSTLVESSKHYLMIRYTLLPYLYTLFYKAHTTGETVVRPVMHEFYSDSSTWEVDRQFLWGKHLLITPVLDPASEGHKIGHAAEKSEKGVKVRAYIPDAVWYDYETMERVAHRRHRLNPMGLIIALDDNNQAAGELFWDDGDSRETVKTGNYIHYKFTVVYGVLTMQVTHAGYRDPDNLKFENITVLGVPHHPVSVSVTHVTRGNSITNVLGTNIQYDAVKKVQWELDMEEYQRFDCHPEEHADEAKCKARGCIWEPSNIERVPWCFYPKDYGYMVTATKETNSGMTIDITRNKKYRSSGRPESPDIDTLRVEIHYHNGHMLQFKVKDPATDRYEVPVPLTVPDAPDTNENNRLYKVHVTHNPFGIQVVRKSTGTKIWDSSVPGFTFSDMFIQVSTRLSSEFVYGFGETEHPTFKHNLNYHTWDVTFQPTPALTYRTVGGILDFYMVLGPTPEMVVQEYTELIGRPVLPAYWSLGFQLCRYGYSNDQEISDLYRDMRAAGIPYDVQYADIDYMDRQLDFVLDPEFTGLPALVDRMRTEGMRFIFILDPAISGNETRPYPAFLRGKAADVFIKWPKNISDEIVWGKVWPDFPNVTVDESLDWDTQVELYRAYTAFPDFFRTTTAKWWHQEIKDFYDNILKFDGLWIDMNEPASFVHGTVGGKCLGDPLLENPPYMPRMMEFSLFGIPYTGADICGFFNTAEYEMCLRWMQLGAFYPYSRNHNGKGSPGARHVDGYVPDARWYDFHTAQDVGVRSQMVRMPAPMDHINLHIRGGYILPWQKPENNTFYSRKNPLGLIVALSDNGTAQGSLFWDDGEGIDTIQREQYMLTSFAAESSTLSSQVKHNGLAAADRLTLGVVKVWGAGSVKITEVTLIYANGTVQQLTPQHNPDTQELIIDATAKSVRVDQPFSITWRTTV